MAKDRLVYTVLYLLCYRLQESKTGRLNILYNSQLSFHQRLYLELEATLFHIHLYKPLSSIMKQPLLYLRDMIPSACFQALTRFKC